MLRHRWILGLALTGALFVAACDDDDPVTPALETFTATLNGANEKPTAVVTPATGTANFTLNAAGTELSYTLTATGLTAGASNAHIHIGVPANAGGVVVPLNFTAAATAFTTTGTINAASFAAGSAFSMTRLLTLMRTDSAYVNVHTTGANASGEIRGQLHH
jgi:hypothetical protein